ncbi:DarT ssDNA thymidine ADP-ribosyltransferase family protein [Cryobacterium sp. BB736]|uniref:DarT ssDNA thymidine ADP-ribosyltransferase family protein n=1 Tax=Cryobacterium sp. BB736 TaxID=2746963 RepID=UPI00187735DE|nr:DarT ssDNA thymidine ADP-ribosyltransferase family protein [Cryobacterium sp. BB736]
MWNNTQASTELRFCAHSLEVDTCMKCVFGDADPPEVWLSSYSGASVFHATDDCSLLIGGKQKQGTLQNPDVLVSREYALSRRLPKCSECYAATGPRTWTATEIALHNRRVDYRLQIALHATPIANLAQIACDKALHSWRSEDRSALPAVDISSPQQRTARARIVDGTSSTVDEYVPFALTPRSEFWRSIVDPPEDPEPVTPVATDFAILVSDYETLRRNADIVITSGDAGSPNALFATSADALHQLLSERAGGNGDWPLEKSELLVRGFVPTLRIKQIVVSDHAKRQQVEALFSDRDKAPVVNVLPKWFGL